MTFSLESMWESMGFVARAVAVSLVVMGLATLAVVVERAITLWRSSRRSRRFAREVAPLIRRGEYEQAVLLADAHSVSHMAQLFAAGLRTYVDAARRTGQLPPIELCRRELARRIETVVASLRRGLGVLASVGSVAPFVGLFGTVVGIISAFHGIAETGSGGISAVAGGIAEALIVTGLGLAVAVPAVLLFNYLSTTCDSFERALGTAASELVDHIESGHLTPLVEADEATLQPARNGRTPDVARAVA